jgi:hypothetical protein
MRAAAINLGSGAGYQGFHSFDDAAIIMTGLGSIELIEVECVLTRDPAVSESPR